LNRLRIIIPQQPFANVFTRVMMPPLGPLYVASAVRKAGGWEVEVIDENNWVGRGDHRALQARRPADVVGFYGGMTSAVPRLYRIARQYREIGIFTIAGGGHVDCLQEEALTSGVDVVVNGEGELSTPELLSAWERGGDFSKVNGISFLDGDGKLVITPRRPPIADFSSIPQPDFSMVVERRRPMHFLPIAHMRGCPYHCEFCSVNRLLGDTHGHSVRETMEHLEDLVGQGYRSFFFVDDNFAGDRERTIELCTRIQELAARNRAHLKLIVQLRADAARDEELMRAMRDAGVEMVALGLESPLPEDLRSMKKGQTVEGMKRDLATFRRFGFYIHGMFIFGYPQRPGIAPPQVPLWMQARIFLDFIRKTGIDTVQVFKAVPVPGTKLFERLQAQNRILPLKLLGWEYYDGNFLTYLPDNGSFAQVHDGAVWIMRKFYSAANLLRLALLALFGPLVMGTNSVRNWFMLLRQRLAENGRRKRNRSLTPRELWQVARESVNCGYRDFARSFRNALFRSGGYFLICKWSLQTRHSRFMALLRRFRMHPPGTSETR